MSRRSSSGSSSLEAVISCRPVQPQPALDAAGQPGVERVADVADDQTDRRRACPAAQLAGDAVGPEAQPAGGDVHLVRGRGGDVRLAVEHPRCRLQADPGQPGDVDIVGATVVGCGGRAVRRRPGTRHESSELLTTLSIRRMVPTGAHRTTPGRGPHDRPRTPVAVTTRRHRRDSGRRDRPDGSCRHRPPASPQSPAAPRGPGGAGRGSPGAFSTRSRPATRPRCPTPSRPAATARRCATASCGTAALPGSVITSSTPITASAENPPGEVATNLADADPGTKWLAFAADRDADLPPAAGRGDHYVRADLRRRRPRTRSRPP